MMDEELTLEERVLRSLRRIARAIGMHSRQLKREFQLTAPQLICLRHLKNGPCSPGALARAVSLSPGTITGILDRLENRGLLLRTRLQTDKRRVLVVLTEQAQELVREAPAPLHHKFSRRLRELPPDQQTVIDDTLMKIVSMMEAESLDAAPMLTTEAIMTEADDGL